VRGVLLGIGLLMMMQAAVAEEIVVDSFDSEGGWYWAKDRGGIAEISAFAANGTGALHFQNLLDYGDRYEKVFSIGAENLENYVVSVWFYNNNSYTNVDIYVIDDLGVECSNSINSGLQTGQWSNFNLRIGDFEKCDYQSLTEIDRIQFYIGESPADIYIDELRIETSDEPLPPDGYTPPTYDPRPIDVEEFNGSADTAKRGEPVSFTGRISSETGISTATLEIDGSSFPMQRYAGTIYNGSYTYTFYPAGDMLGEYGAAITARDLGGNSTSSGAFVFTVDPYIAVSAQANNSVPYKSLLEISGTLSQAYSPVTFSITFSGDGWSHEEVFEGTDTFTHHVNTSVGLPGLWEIAVSANDVYGNQGAGNITAYVLSFENQVLDVLFLEPVESEFHHGETVPMSVSVEREGSPISGADVVGNVGGVGVELQGDGVYSGSYQIPWEWPEGPTTIYVEATDGDDGGINSLEINVLESQFDPEFEEEDFIIGFAGSISLNLTFNDSTPVTNATIIGTVGGENITFVEVEPGVYRAEYTPKGNETEMVIVGSGGFSFTYPFTSRYPTVFDYITHNVWTIVGGGIVMASGVILIRRRMRH
jgi:hypothetical protein